MKRILTVTVLISTMSIFFNTALFAQEGVLIDYVGSTRDNSAGLDVRSANQGMLAPRVALTATVAAPISSPATSLLVYNTATVGTSPNNVSRSQWHVIATNYVWVATCSGDVQFTLYVDNNSDADDNSEFRDIVVIAQRY